MTTNTSTRAAAVAACAVVLALSLGGCGGGGAAAKRTSGETIRLWVMNNGPRPVADTKRIVAPFERRTGIKVAVELVGWDTQFDRIRNAAGAGEGPDVTQAGTTQVPFFAATGGFENLTSRLRDVGGAPSYADGVWKTTQVAGLRGTWAIPWFTEARAIYYRKDALRAAGVDPATAFKTWASFKATLQRLRSVKRLAGARSVRSVQFAADLVRAGLWERRWGWRGRSRALMSLSAPAGRRPPWRPP